MIQVDKVMIKGDQPMYIRTLTFIYYDQKHLLLNSY